MARRGRREWERELGFGERPGVAGAVRWSEPNVLAALTEFTSGRETYPSRAEFQLAGLDGLHQAIASTTVATSAGLSGSGWARGTDEPTARRFCALD
jgi:hypothetical protein